MPGRIGFLTGTFDPVHLGHVALAEAAIREFGLDRVLLWVNAQVVHKVGVTPYADRMAMARLAVSGHAGLGVYGGELSGRPQVPKWFRELERSFSEELVYIVGADILSTLHRWDDVESVVENSTFLIADRGGQAAGLLEGLRRELGSLGERLKAEMFAFGDYGTASSSKVRVQVRAGERPEELDLQVYEYIVTNGLYGS